MNNWLISASVGAILLLVGLVMMRSHTRSWRQQNLDTTLDEFDRQHYYARYRRRLQTSAMIALVGILIAVGDSPLIPWRNFQRAFAVYWVVVLMFTLWIVLLAIGDLSSSRAHSQVALARVRKKQRDLESQVEQIKRRGSNGHPHRN